MTGGSELPPPFISAHPIAFMLSRSTAALALKRVIQLLVVMQTQVTLSGSSSVAPNWEPLFNAVSGRLFQGVPFAQPCFSGSWNSSACLTIQNNYTNEVIRSQSSTAYIQTQWETCQATGEQCLLDYLDPHDVNPTLPPQKCSSGSVPSYFVNVTSADDVTAALNFANSTKIPLVIKNTGHDYKGRSSAPGSIAIWTHNLKNMTYSPKFVPSGCKVSPRQAVTFGAGVQWGEAYAFADANNVTVVGGSDIAVGASGGWLQGGGHGALSPSMGLGVDRTLEYKVVTPDGKLRVANECQNTDLFWALRGGGGGTFGVVLESTVLASPRVALPTLIFSFPHDANTTGRIWTIMAENGLKWAKEGWGGFSQAGVVILLNPKLTMDEAQASLAPLLTVGKELQAANATATNVLFTEFPSWFAFSEAFTSAFVAITGSSLALASRLVPSSLFETHKSQSSLVSALLAADAATPGLIILISAPSAYKHDPHATSVTKAWRSSIYHVTVVSAWNWNATLEEKQGHYRAASKSIDNLRRITPVAAYQNEADVHEPNHEELLGWQLSEAFADQAEIVMIPIIFLTVGIVMLFLPIQLIALVATFLAGPISALPTNSGAQLTNTNEGKKLTTSLRGYDIPITRTLVKRSSMRKRGTLSGQSGLGDNADLLYTVPIELGNTVTAVNLDTGSSDLWAVSDACQIGTCNGSPVTRYPAAAENSTGVDVKMTYGDSTSGTYAQGTVGLDTATVAGIAMTDQAFGVVNDTNNIVVQYDTAGIFGLGFPAGSKIQEAVVTAKDGPINPTDDFLLATYTDGPLLSRIMMTGALEAPMFTITLNRNTIDIGGTGQLTLGKLPDGVDNSSLTWVPVRLYTPDEGGLHAPNFAPNEVYPFRWEIDLDAVFMDGQQLPTSKVPALNGVDSTRMSALIDTGNSIIRGPEDVVNSILKMVSPSYDPTNEDSTPIFPCKNVHTLGFQIGGKMFPIDPRDFIGQNEPNDATTCVADNLVTTDPPRFGALFRWSLGDPFFRSNLVAFHYGNLTHPSVDPPRIGFMSLVPPNANDLYAAAVNDAVNNGGNFEQTINVAPTASAASAPQVTVSVGSEPSIATHLSAAATLTLQATTMATPTGDARRPSSALSNLRTWRENGLSSVIICLSSVMLSTVFL
ncbi:hypothetical protein NP233_g3700 [Leucocoprinus birnbaumii]|uniref:FAD-binding PCMH-type domain-containing protein n=1 Tax=Leucocoprinus birnbaumii TaxID=56174 RepID=A0AAD5VYP5_9AGAR|nr:hypothetical protein NP233_g3700 [Leucocoprinus birnbaumii]